MAQLETPCVEHTGPTRGGYGYVYVDGKSWRRHRYAYYTKYGPIPEGAVVRQWKVAASTINRIVRGARRAVEELSYD